MTTALKSYLEFIKYDCSSVEEFEELVNCDFLNFKNILVQVFLPDELYCDVEHTPYKALTKLVAPEEVDILRENYIYLTQTKFRLLPRHRLLLNEILNTN